MSASAQKPSVGRVVHYVARGSADGRFPATCRMAFVTETADDGLVGLMVANPSGLFFHPLEMGGCDYDEENKAGGTWHWPERV
jgi:hypothetical protein